MSDLEARAGHASRPIHDEALAHVQGLDANVDEITWKQGLRKAWLWCRSAKYISPSERR